MAWHDNFRFGLRGVLVLVTVSACLFAAFQYGYQQGYSFRQRTTPEAKCVAKVYFVRDLVLYPVGEDKSPLLSSYDLSEAIATLIDPEGWEVRGGPGGIRPFKDTFVIWNTLARHEEIAEFLRLLRGETEQVDTVRIYLK